MEGSGKFGEGTSLDMPKDGRGYLKLRCEEAKGP